jgi:hypothetical protein
VTVSTNPGIDNTWFTSDDTYASQSAIGNPADIGTASRMAITMYCDCCDLR